MDPNEVWNKEWMKLNKLFLDEVAPSRDRTVSLFKLDEPQKSCLSKVEPV